VYPACGGGGGGGDDTRAVAAASGRTRTASDSDRRRIARLGDRRAAADFTLRDRKSASKEDNWHDRGKVGHFDPETERLLARLISDNSR